MTNDTLPLTVANTGFMLDRMGEDCSPLQFIRELTQNSIESIQRIRATVPGYDGKIVWDADWMMHDLEGGPLKLSITDNGDGMSGPDMVRFINQLSCSGSKQAMDGNFGVGAKIAAATRNHAGLVYVSWHHGVGSTVHLWRDPETGTYGLRQFERPKGGYGHYATVDDGLKPELIREHGTKVVLLGNSGDENTMLAPEGWTAKDRWICRYLNTRYFRFPEGITISAREGLQKTSDGKRSKGLVRNAYGQAHFLERGALAHGDVELNGAKAFWWIVKPADELVTEGPSYETTGHVGALYNNELYEMLTGRSGRALLQQFGILFGTKRVVIYVAPTVQGLTTNTARTRLSIDRQPLPWSEWAAEFRSKMPNEIRDLMDQVASQSVATNHENTIRERLKPLLDLYRLSRYRFSPQGTERADASTLSGGTGSQGERSGNGGSRGPRRRHSTDGPAGGIYGIFQKDDGELANRVSPDAFPNVRWVSARTNPPTRDEGDIEDKAARYLNDQNILLINADFRVFTDLIERLSRQFDGQPGALQICESVARLWFEQTLVETVIGVQALRGSREWNDRQIEMALSEEALTSAVLPRYHVFNVAKRDIGTKLGRAY